MRFSNTTAYFQVWSGSWNNVLIRRTSMSHLKSHCLCWRHRYTEKNSPKMLTNLHLLRQFRSKRHRSDKIPTDAAIVPVKHYLLHEDSKKFVGMIIFFVLKAPPWTMVTMNIFSSETYSWDRNRLIYYRAYVLNCLFGHSTY